MSIPYPSKSRTWALTTDANGTYVNTEIDQLYANDNQLNSDLTDTNTTQAQIMATKDGYYQNAFLDPRFQVWPEGTSFTYTAGAGASDGGYTSAMALASVSDNKTIVVSPYSFSLGSGALPKNPKKGLQCTVSQTGGSNRWALATVKIYDVQKFSNEKASFSVWAAGATGQKVRVAISQNFGTGGNPSSAVVVSTQTFTFSSSVWQQLKIENVSFPSVSGKTLGTNNDDYIQIELIMAGNVIGDQSGTFIFADAVLNGGEKCLEIQPKTQAEYEADVRPWINVLGSAYMASAQYQNPVFVSQSFFHDMIRTPVVTTSGNSWYRYSGATAPTIGSMTTGVNSKKFGFWVLPSGGTDVNACTITGIKLDCRL